MLLNASDDTFKKDETSWIFGWSGTNNKIAGIEYILVWMDTSECNMDGQLKV